VIFPKKTTHGLLLAALAWPAAATLPAAEPTAIFSFDDVTLPYRYHLALTMVPATKYRRNPVVPNGPPDAPDGTRAQFYGSVIRVEGKFRMWYIAIAHGGGPRTVEAPEKHVTWPAYAESTDGIHWIKPELGLVDYHGNKRNNLLSFSPAPRFDLTEPLVVCVLHEPSDPDPSRRYKMALYGRYLATYYPDYRRTGIPFHRATIYPYFSPDGYHWTLANSAPGGIYNDQNVTIPVDHIFELAGLYKFRGLYSVAGQQEIGSVLLPTGEAGARTMETHFSPDFIHWSKDYSVSFVRYGYRSKRDWNEAHEGATVWNRHNVLLGLYGEWNGAPDRKDARMPLGFLLSNDGVHFREPKPDFVLIEPGGDGQWDRHGLINGQGFENVGDRTYLYFGAWDLSRLDNRNIPRPEEGPWKDTSGGVGLAFLRRDGFGYLSVRGEGEALCTTAPLEFPGAGVRIRVNAEGLGPDARMRIDLLDAQGVAVLLGLRHANSVHTYLRRYPAMPRPVLDLGPGRPRLWLRPEVERWLIERTGSS